MVSKPNTSFLRLPICLWEDVRLWLSNQENLFFVVLIVVHLLPIWFFKYFPSSDGPAHIENPNILREYYFPNRTLLRALAVLFVAVCLYVLRLKVVHRQINSWDGFFLIAAAYSVDYVLVWSVFEERDYVYTKSIFRQLEKGYELIYTSPQRGLMQLYRRRNWKT